MTDDPISVPLDPESERAAAELASLEGRITRALGTAPRFAVPADFAARVTARVSDGRSVHGSKQPAIRSGGVPLTYHEMTVRHYGRNAAIVSLAVLLAMIVLFAHRSVGTSRLWISAEAIFCLQFALLAVWLVARDLQKYFSAWTSQG